MYSRLPKEQEQCVVNAECNGNSSPHIAGYWLAHFSRASCSSTCACAAAASATLNSISAAPTHWPSRVAKFRR